jgi:hypothetical protein
MGRKEGRKNKKGKNGMEERRERTGWKKENKEGRGRKGG